MNSWDVAQMLSHVRLFAVPWTVAHQAPLSVGFAKQGYWNGLPFPSPEDQKLTCLHAPASCLGNSLNRKAWPATVHEVTDSDMTERLTHTHTHKSSLDRGFPGGSVAKNLLASVEDAGNGFDP